MTNALTVGVGKPNPTHRHLHGRSFLKELDFTVGEWHEAARVAQRPDARLRMPDSLSRVGDQVRTGGDKPGGT
jgi:hypothetical protein